VVNRPFAVAAGLLADVLFGEPPLQPHPVALLGSALERIEGTLYRDRKANGVVHAVAGVALGATAGRVLGSTAVATYVACSGRALRDAACEVERALDADDLASARSLLPSLVGRDPNELDEKEVCRAVVESVAENTVDAIVAPALWAFVAGAPGVVAHRAINTMDAMIGHRDARYTDYGWAAARLDDAAAWVPARVTAALVAACRPRAAGRVAHVVRRDAGAHPSPNAGVAEAAFAAALDLRLGGETRYGDRVELRPVLGDGRPPERRDIAQANELSRDVTFALAGLLAATGVARWMRR
jgi:adenosylcobinamide-phosphate synthase